MSTQTISDYITKQIFIEKNVVTYRSLSRQFSLHVNVAKNELATYHHNAPYQSRSSFATFLISGMPKVDPGRNADVDMDQTQDSDNVEERDGTDEGDSDEVSQTTVLLVNENDLEGAKAKYDAIHTVYVYSLAPVPLIDPALICECTESIRKIDRSKGADWAATVGLVVLSGIKTGPPRKGKPMVAPQAPCNAGPSKSKPPPPESASTRTEPVKTEMKLKQASSFNTTSDKGKEKNNGTGKLNFFAKRKDAKRPEEVKKVKKEEGVVNLNNKMFFSKPAEKASETTTSGASTKVEKGKGKNPSSRDDVPTKVKTEKSLAPAESSISVARRQGAVILSDDESDKAPVKAASSRKSHASFKSESSVAADSEAERDVRALMDLDDDQVERVSHAPSTAVSELEDPSETDSAPVKIEQDDGGDVDMADHSAVQTRPKKRKAKTTIPVGRNGLKKRKIVNTTSRQDDHGYTHIEDHTDWESVDDEEPQPEKQRKSKSKSITVKKEEVTKEDERLPSVTPEEVKRKDNEATRKAGPSKPTRAKAKASGNVKTKKGLMNFFGPSKKT